MLNPSLLVIMDREFKKREVMCIKRKRNKSKTEKERGENGEFQ